MPRRLLTYALLLCALLSCAPQDRGWLLAIGGGEKPPAAIERFVSLCHGGLILVITSASDFPWESGPETTQLLTDAGAKAQWLHIGDRQTADAESTATKIDAAAGLFLTGGVQTKFMARIGGTRTEAAIHRLFFERKGAVAGTSAGAAVLSEVMITGRELIADDSLRAFSTLMKGNIETARGLGLIRWAVVDQHFAKQKRLLRLMSAVLEHPQLVGLGIDEDTALLISPDLDLEVFGTGPVLLMDARRARAVRSDEQGRLAALGLRIDVLIEGEHEQLKKPARAIRQNTQFKVDEKPQGKE